MKPIREFWVKFLVSGSFFSKNCICNEGCNHMVCDIYFYNEFVYLDDCFFESVLHFIIIGLMFKWVVFFLFSLCLFYFSISMGAIVHTHTRLADFLMTDVRSEIFSLNIMVIVRRAGLIWSQQDFEWWWSVPLYHTWVWNRGICMCVIVRPRSHMLIVLKKVIPDTTRYDFA